MAAQRFPGRGGVKGVFLNGAGVVGHGSRSMWKERATLSYTLSLTCRMARKVGGCDVKVQ